MPKTFSGTLCEQTPTIAISDNRGLGIRALAYNRTNASDAPEELISRNRYNARGQLIASRDPRLAVDNFNYQYSLAGTPLRTCGVDSGTIMQLIDAEGRPVISLDAKGTRRWAIYEPELGRPLAHQQQPKGGLKTVTDRFFYGENSREHKAANLNGQCIRHYDTAGLQELLSLSITGVVLMQQRRVLTDTLGPVDWFAEEGRWFLRLSRKPFITTCTTNALGQLITQTNAKGHTQRMSYNCAGQLIASWLTLYRGVEQVIVRALTYSAAGQKLREESGNGVVTEYRYEPQTQRLIGIKTTRPERVQGPKVLQDLRYDYDPVGNILAIHNDAEATRFYRNQKVVPETTYRYDALYQLIEATGRESDNNSAQSAALPALSSLTDGNQYVNYTRSYTYDRAGNLLKIQHSGASQYSTHITLSDTSNHGIQQQDGLTAADIRGQFDAAGNQRQLQPGQPLQWDARHQLQQVTTVKRGAENSASDDYESYLYGSDGMRVVKQSIQHTNNTTQTTTVTYLPGLELHTQHNGQQPTEDFQVIACGAAGRAQVRVLLWKHGKPEGIDDAQLRYSFDNQIGSSLLELDNNGDIISQEEYYPFGGTAVFSARHTMEAKYKTVRYSGKERDATGLYYYGHRYYQPWLGRWLSADPAGTIDGLNLYRMVRNNPVGLMDEDGLGSKKNIKKYFYQEFINDERITRIIISNALKLKKSKKEYIPVIKKENVAIYITTLKGNDLKLQSRYEDKFYEKAYKNLLEAAKKPITSLEKIKPGDILYVGGHGTPGKGHLGAGARYSNNKVSVEEISKTLVHSFKMPEFTEVRVMSCYAGVGSISKPSIPEEIKSNIEAFNSAISQSGDFGSSLAGRLESNIRAIQPRREIGLVTGSIGKVVYDYHTKNVINSGFPETQQPRGKYVSLPVENSKKEFNFSTQSLRRSAINEPLW